MINASMGELLLILVVSLVVFKPEDLAKICTTLGRNVGKVRSLLFRLKHNVTDELDGLHNTIILAKENTPAEITKPDTHD